MSINTSPVSWPGMTIYKNGAKVPSYRILDEQHGLDRVLREIHDQVSLLQHLDNDPSMFDKRLGADRSAERGIVETLSVGKEVDQVFPIETTTIFQGSLSDAKGEYNLLEYSEERGIGGFYTDSLHPREAHITSMESCGDVRTIRDVRLAEYDPRSLYFKSYKIEGITVIDDRNKTVTITELLADDSYPPVDADWPAKPDLSSENNKKPFYFDPEELKKPVTYFSREDSISGWCGGGCG